ncbi:MAG TPA: hypothetical protein VGN80_05780 [Devosiaceae bacterium]|jgi:hypothetical protein|nr:hypothetical protein [Devosiaceae bacterium]
MRLCTAFVALALLCAPPAAAGETAFAAVEVAPAAVSADVMRSMGLDQLFIQFGRSIAQGPRQQGITDEHFLAAWEPLSRDLFEREELNARLVNMLDRGLEAAELARVQAFLTSPFGNRVTRLEQQAQAIPGEQQIAAIARGQVLYLQAGAARQALLEDLLALSGAEVTFAVLGESLRGMAVGMHLMAHGDLDIPWDEIDALIETRLTGMRQSLDEASRGALALTYAELSDDELADYVAFLGAPATRKFYTVASVTVGALIREAMFALGEDVAARLQRVSI